MDSFGVPVLPGLGGPGRVPRLEAERGSGSAGTGHAGAAAARHGGGERRAAAEDLDNESIK